MQSGDPRVIADSNAATCISLTNGMAAQMKVPNLEKLCKKSVANVNITEKFLSTDLSGANSLRVECIVQESGKVIGKELCTLTEKSSVASDNNISWKKFNCKMEKCSEIIGYILNVNRYCEICEMQVEC